MKIEMKFGDCIRVRWLKMKNWRVCWRIESFVGTEEAVVWGVGFVVPCRVSEWRGEGF